MQYITIDTDGNITAMADFEFSGAVPTEKKVLLGWDGVLYFEGDPRIEKPESVQIEQNKASVRALRTAKIEATQWILQRHLGEVAANHTTTLSETKYQEWLAYHQALRDLPSQPGFPWNGGGENDNTCPWPVEPVESSVIPPATGGGGKLDNGVNTPQPPTEADSDVSDKPGKDSGVVA